MRKHFHALLLCALFAAAGSVAAAQQPAPDALPSGPGWGRVMAIPSGSTLYVRGRTRSAHCKVKSADADSLTCANGDGTRTDVFQKSEIKSVRVPHRARSAAAGAAVGAAGGALAGVAIGKNGQIIGKGGLAAIFAIPLAVVGALVGVATDFAGSTIYRA